MVFCIIHDVRTQGAEQIQNVQDLTLTGLFGFVPQLFKDWMILLMISCTMPPLWMTRNHSSNVENCTRTLKVVSGKVVLPSVGWYKCMMMCPQHFWTCAQFHAQNVVVIFPAVR